MNYQNQRNNKNTGNGLLVLGIGCLILTLIAMVWFRSLDDYEYIALCAKSALFIIAGIHFKGMR